MLINAASLLDLLEQHFYSLTSRFLRRDSILANCITREHASRRGMRKKQDTAA